MILQLLKSGTRDVHERLEKNLDLLDDSLTDARYDELLQRFYGFYAPFEPLLFNRKEWDTLDFDIQARRKLPLLEHDLRWRGFTEAQIRDSLLCTSLPDVQSFARALGSLYVLEGSTLGSQILSRHFTRVLNTPVPQGVTFFYSYGEQVGPMWRSFGAMLQQQATTPLVQEQMIDAAHHTFTTLEMWLCS